MAILLSPRRAPWAWAALAACLGVALYALSYAWPGVPLAPTLANVGLMPGVLALHALAAAVALAAGAAQLVVRRAGAGLRVHRWTGRTYAVAVAVGGLAGLALAPTASAGPVAAWGFGVLAVLWLGTTAVALVAVWTGRIARHRRWMARSLALAAAAVTLRVQLPAALAAGVPFATAYPLIAWACWVPNLVLVELWLRTGRADPTGLAAPVPAGVPPRA